MWPSRRDLVPYLAAFPLPQNSTIYIPGGNPEIQNQEDAMTWPSSAPWSEQAVLAPYSRQESGVRLPQDQMTGDVVLGNQNWPFQNRFVRRENMWPDFKNGEVVMVRCNQRKWLQGTIQRMSAQGLRIWIADVDFLVNVPLVLVPTHVLKMPRYSALQVLPPPEPLWTMAISDSTGCRKSLVQCVRPAHLSHRQLFYKLSCIECAFCNTTGSSADMLRPWNCSHQAHNYCLQLRMEHSSTSACPSCNETGTSQGMSLSSTGNDSILQVMPSSTTDRDLALQIVPPTFTGIGSTFEFMPFSSTSDVRTSSSNGQHQQWFDVLQCACGFTSSINGLINKNAPVFCPNCQQPAYIKPMTIGTQSGERFASINQPRAYTVSVDRESLERSSIQDQGFWWPMQYLGGPRRLDAIEEGSREGNCSTPPSTEHDEPSYLPSYLLAFGETFENNMSDPDVVAVSSVDQNMKPSPSSRSVVQDDISASSPTRVTLVQNGLSSTRSSLHDGVLTAPSPTRVTLIQNKQSNARSSSQDGTLPAPSFTQVNDNAPASSTKHLIGPAESTHDNLDEFSEVEEADKSSKELELRSSTIASNDGQTLWRRVSDVDWLRKTHDEDIEKSEEGSSSDDFAAISPISPPVYVNHFADFVKLAMANASTAKDILECALQSPSSSTAHLPPLKSRTPPFMTPVDLAFEKPAPAFFTRPSALVTEAPAAVSPPPAFFTRPSALITEAPVAVSPPPAFFTGPSALITEAPVAVSPTPASFTRPSALITEAPVAVSPPPAFFTRPSALITEATTAPSPVRAFYSRSPVLSMEPQPALLTDAPATVIPVRTFFSRAPGLITQPPAWVTAAKDPNGGDASPAWITVIKDGVDSRKDDVNQ